jgi:hypothetical protein
VTACRGRAQARHLPCGRPVDAWIPSRLLTAPAPAGRAGSHFVGKNPDHRKAGKPAYRKQEIRPELAEGRDYEPLKS